MESLGTITFTWVMGLCDYDPTRWKPKSRAVSQDVGVHNSRPEAPYILTSGCLRTKQLFGIFHLLGDTEWTPGTVFRVLVSVGTLHQH